MFIEKRTNRLHRKTCILLVLTLFEKNMTEEKNDTFQTPLTRFVYCKEVDKTLILALLRVYMLEYCPFTCVNSCLLSLLSLLLFMLCRLLSNILLNY